jgi:Zn-dependent protease
MNNQSLSGSVRLFKLFGITVYLHWTWFVMLMYVTRLGTAHSWALIYFLTVFAIVVMHEFGHALACRSVGGKAERIVLWPLGGVAFVNPPQRPGAVLWSIAAGPLVNVVLIPILFGLLFLPGVQSSAAIEAYLKWVFWFNLVILIFNMLPIYPLDGGQILQSLLWFFLGRTKSLYIATVIGLIAAVAGGIFALMVGNMWLVVMAGFIGLQAYNGFRAATILAAYERQGGDRI